MSARERRSTTGLLFACGIVCTLLFIAALPAWVQAHSNDLPPRPSTATPTPQPTNDLPPRPPAATPPPARPAGAWIELNCQIPAQSLPVYWSVLWTTVQWQDSGGRWHDVEGWQGELDEVANGVGKKVWWVAEQDFGRGSFRWIVRRGYGGELLAESEPFHLPGTGGQTVWVGVVLTP